MKNNFDWFKISHTDNGIILTIRDEYDRFEDVNLPLTYGQIYTLKKAFAKALELHNTEENLVRYHNG